MTGDPSRLPVLQFSCSALVLWVAFHHQSADLTAGEIALAVALIGACLWGVLALFVSPESPPTALRWGLALGAWYLFNVPITLARGMGLDAWLRAAFPAILFPGCLVLGWIAFRNGTWQRRITVWIAVVGAIVIVNSLIGLRPLAVGDLTDLQAIRQFGGDYCAPLTLTIALPFLLTACGRRSLWWPFSLALVVLGGIGLAVSLTRTYWVSTGLSISFLVALLAMRHPRDLYGLALGTPLLLAIVVLFLVPKIPDNILSFLVERVTDLGQITQVTSVQYRIAEAAGALRAQLQMPLTFFSGNGFGAVFSFEYVNPASAHVHGAAVVRYIHNYYIYLLFVVGGLGLTLFVAVWLSAFRAILTGFQRDASDTHGLEPVRLAAVTAGVNLMITSATAPQFMGVQFPVTFGFLVAAAIGSNTLAPPAVTSSTTVSNVDEPE